MCVVPLEPSIRQLWPPHKSYCVSVKPASLKWTLSDRPAECSRPRIPHLCTTQDYSQALQQHPEKKKNLEESGEKVLRGKGSGIYTAGRLAGCC